MSLNTAHTDNGILLYQGEQIVLYAENVTMKLEGNKAPEFKGSKSGKMSLTTHRLIFSNDKKNDLLRSFSMPFVTLSDLGLEQPVFGANYIKGLVTAQPNGSWTGTAKVQLTFKNGGACEFGMSMSKLVDLAKRFSNGPPPAYAAPEAPMYQAPPPAYTPNPSGYYGWMPPTQVFPGFPPANQVYMVDVPPPYPGIFGMQNPYAGASCPPPADAKAAEAAQSAYYDPSAPQYAYVPPPAYYERPPPYDHATANKKDQ